MSSSGKRRSGSTRIAMPKKMTLAMLKGKPSTLSVPSIRFNSGEEDLTEVENELSHTAIGQTSSIAEDVVRTKRLSGSERWNVDGIRSSISKRSSLFTSNSAEVPKEPSPVRENPGRMGKRSSSLDSGGCSMDAVVASANSEPRSLFHELKGKLTKTVEETLHIDLGAADELRKGSGLSMDGIGHSMAAGALILPTEVAEEAFVLLDEESPELNLPVAARTGASERLRQLSFDLKHRRSRLLHRTDASTSSPAFTMSALVTQSQDEDALEEQLHSEYDSRASLKNVTSSGWRTTPSASEDEYVLAPPPPPPPDPGPGSAQSCTTASRISSLPFPNNVRRWALYAAIVALLFVIPLPPFIMGLATGISLMIFGMIVHSRYIAPRPKSETPLAEECEWVQSAQAHLQIPIVRVKPPEVHKGWINELRQTYDQANYHVSQTCPVFVRLEGSLLRISHPRGKIPRHASWNESTHDTSFFHQRYYHLAGSRVVLLPLGLTRKRLWSRKYPLCLQLTETACRTGHLCVSPSEDDDHPTEETASTSCAAAFTAEESLYLFARTCREKEEWYWRFLDATKRGETGTITSSSTTMWSEAKTRSEPGVKDVPLAPAPEALQELNTYMQQWLPTVGEEEPATVTMAPVPEGTSISAAEANALWVNVLLGRIFWDFLREPAWAEKLTARIQRKLNKIKVPYFMDELTLTTLELGDCLPTIERISAPLMDVQGLWIDVDLTYKGKFCMTLETKLNLMKLGKEPAGEIPASPPTHKSVTQQTSNRTIAAFDSDEEDSAESSTDDDADMQDSFVPPDEIGGATSWSGLAANQGGGATSKKILRFVDKITQSRYFQQATEYKYVKKAMQGVSNTRLILRVDLSSLIGTLAINIPPPPTDRLWYGFRSPPKISMVARPRLGEREVTVASVTEWIENKLVQEFHKFLVMPNMDDLVIPIMTSGITYSIPVSESEIENNR